MVSTDEFRQAMSRWSTGVTVITAAANGTRHGMVASSFAAVSAEPPTVLFCAEHRTRTYPLVRDSGAFAVGLLSEEQEDVLRVFAGWQGDHDADRFAGRETAVAVTGAPVLAGCLAWLDCRVVAEYPGGTTHSIFVGEVLATGEGDGEGDGEGEGAPGGDDEPRPLLYYHRKVRRLAAEP